ncbi:MAG: hypothetical protein R3F59_29040 [Myxococcota bacterium]
MADRHDPKRKERPLKKQSVEDWLAQRLAMVDDLDGEPGDEGEDDATTVKASLNGTARTIPPSRPGAVDAGPVRTAPATPFDEPLADFEAEPLGTEDVEPLLTEEAEPIEAPSDTDEQPAPDGLGEGLSEGLSVDEPARPAPTAPDEAMWDLLGETTGSRPLVSVPAAPPAAPPDAPTEEAPRRNITLGRPSLGDGRRASEAPTIPPASIKLGNRVATPGALDAEPPVRRPPVAAPPRLPGAAAAAPDDGEATVADPRVDALIAEARHSPRPRRRRTAFSKHRDDEDLERRPLDEADSADEPGALVAGETLTPAEDESEAEPATAQAGGFDEVFLISRGIPPVRARTGPPPLAPEPTSHLTEVGGPGHDAREVAEKEAAEGRTEWAPRDPSDAEVAVPGPGSPALDGGAESADTEDDDVNEKTVLRPVVSEAPREAPAVQARDEVDDEPADPDAPTRRAFPAVVPRPSRAERARAAELPTRVPESSEPPTVERRFYGPTNEELSESALPPEVSSAVITWGSVIIGVLMFFVTLVMFALFIVPYLAV